MISLVWQPFLIWLSKQLTIFLLCYYAFVDVVIVRNIISTMFF